MTVPPPDLDDRTFDQLRAEAIAFVRARSTSWDDLGPSDPGTVLLEAFAYLTDILLFRLNRVPDKARREFLALIGTRIGPPAAAAVMLELSPAAPAGGPGDAPVVVPSGTAVRAGDVAGGEPVVFLTDADAALQAGAGPVTVSAHHCEQRVAEPLGRSTGEAGQTFQLAAPPVVLPTGHELDLLVAVEATPEELAGRPAARVVDGRPYVVWSVVDSFATVRRDERVVRVDRATGLVTFPPAVRRPHPDGGVDAEAAPLGAVPPAGREIRAWYRRGGGSAGNVAPGVLRSFVAPPAPGVSVTNPGRATGGRDAETVEAALARGPELLHEVRRAVTADDVEAIALSTGGVARARASAESEDWVHAAPGSVEVRLVPSAAGTEGVPGAELLVALQRPGAREEVERLLAERRPLGIRTVVRWAQYKQVTVRLRVVVSRAEDASAVRQRVEDRLRSALSPVPTAGNATGWPFGQALRASNVYDIALREPGVRYADGVIMEVDHTPDGAVQALAADRFQPDTWYAAAGSVLYRSENDAVGWEAVNDFGSGTITRVVPAEDRPGHVAVVLVEEHSARVHVSRDCGSSWGEHPVVAFEWDATATSQEIRDLTWLPEGHADDLLVATDRGLYRYRWDEAAPRPWPVRPDAPDRGCWAVVASDSGEGGVEVAVALRDRAGVWLAGPRPDDPFRAVGLTDTDIRRLVLERRGLRRFLWAPAFAVGNDPGTGCYRSELRGSTELTPAWTHLGAGWDGGICHDLTFLGEEVLAASQFNGVMRGPRDGQEPWTAPSFDASGLPLHDGPPRRFHPVVAVAGAGDTALCGTDRGPYRTTDGESFSPAARRTYDDVVTIPSAWLFASGEHQVTVEAGG